MIEAVPERLDLKREVYTKLGQAAPARTIFATNSSTLLPSAMADFTGRPDRFLALHFADPIRITNFVEVMGHAGTDSLCLPGRGRLRAADRDGADRAHEGATGLHPQLAARPLREGRPGAAGRWRRRARDDRQVWRIFARAPEGPFQMVDRIGLNTAYNVSVFGDEKAQAIAGYLKENFIDRGKLGVATGEGFYKYSAAT